ncbi:MAG TPA: NAD(P)/FAD-dependent oxidoreductase [Paenibacillaceae bacterium]
MSERDVYDVTIVGAGPAGLYAAFYAGLREMKTKIIEYHPFLGGKVNVYPGKLIWDVGGLAPVTGEQLLKQLIRQGTLFDPTVVLGEKVTSIAREGDVFTLHTGSGQVHYSKTVILATGYGILKPVKLQMEGAEKFEATNLRYTVKSMSHYRGKTVLISGGGHAAVDWADDLGDVAGKVYLAYRRDELKGFEATVSKIKKKGVILLPNTVMERLIPTADGSAVARVVLRRSGEGDAASSELDVELDVDEVLVCHGFEYDGELVRSSKVDIRMRGEYWIDGTPHGETSVPGIFAAGDVLGYDGKLHLIAGAFQDAANAVNRAKKFISPEAEDAAMVSSHNERFEEKNKELKKLLF